MTQSVMDLKPVVYLTQRYALKIYQCILFRLGRRRGENAEMPCPRLGDAGTPQGTASRHSCPPTDKSDWALFSAEG